MTQNAAIKLGLEALRESEEDFNREAVEIAIVNGSGYKKMSREDILKHLDKLN
jgi:20S proteasome alpha/beta subunit